MTKELFFIKKYFLKVLLLLICVFPIMFFLNTGFLLAEYWKIIQAAIFTLVFILLMLSRRTKKYIFIMGLILVLIMVIFYVLSLIEWSDMVGSTGIGLITLCIVSYIPQLIKLGYIKDL